MATVAIGGKELMVNELYDLSNNAGVDITILYNDGSGPSLSTNEFVLFNTPVTGSTSSYVDLLANSTFTIPAGGVVESISLVFHVGGAVIATESISVDNSFPDGGDFIVTSFKITVA